MAFVILKGKCLLVFVSYVGLHMADQREWVSQNDNDMEKIKGWYSK